MVEQTRFEQLWDSAYLFQLRHRGNDYQMKEFGRHLRSCAAALRTAYQYIIDDGQCRSYNTFVSRYKEHRTVYYNLRAQQNDIDLEPRLFELIAWMKDTFTMSLKIKIITEAELPRRFTQGGETIKPSESYEVETLTLAEVRGRQEGLRSEQDLPLPLRVSSSGAPASRPQPTPPAHYAPPPQPSVAQPRTLPRVAQPVALPAIARPVVVHPTTAVPPVSTSGHYRVYSSSSITLTTPLSPPPLRQAQPGQSGAPSQADGQDPSSDAPVVTMPPGSSSQLSTAQSAALAAGANAAHLAQQPQSQANWVPGHGAAVGSVDLFGLARPQPPGHGMTGSTPYYASSRSSTDTYSSQGYQESYNSGSSRSS